MMKDRENLDTKYLSTPFDRQVRIELWDQNVIAGQTALILGVGGLGSVVLINLLRLGVKKIILVDYDVVDVHNLNRQLIYSAKDTGRRKVGTAIENSKFHNVGNTQVIGFDGDALKNWQTIVGFAKESNVVFNCIDYGDKFDAAVSSLCLKLQKPLIMGGTFATSLTIDFIPATGKPCLLCSDSSQTSPQILKQIHPDVIQTLTDLTFLPKNNNPIGRSSVVVCTICGEMMVSHYLNELFLSEERPYRGARLIFYHNLFEIIKFDMEREMKCPFCGDPNYVEPKKEEITQSKEENAKKQQTEQQTQKIHGEQHTGQQTQSNESKEQQTQGQQQKSSEQQTDKHAKEESEQQTEVKEQHKGLQTEKKEQSQKSQQTQVKVATAAAGTQ